MSALALQRIRENIEKHQRGEDIAVLDYRNGEEDWKVDRVN